MLTRNRHILPRPPRRLFSTIHHCARAHSPSPPALYKLHICRVPRRRWSHGCNDALALARCAFPSPLRKFTPTRKLREIRTRARIPPHLGRRHGNRPICPPTRRPLPSARHSHNILSHRAPRPLPRRHRHRARQQTQHPDHFRNQNHSRRQHYPRHRPRWPENRKCLFTGFEQESKGTLCTACYDGNRGRDTGECAGGHGGDEAVRAGRGEPGVRAGAE